MKSEKSEKMIEINIPENYKKLMMEGKLYCKTECWHKIMTEEELKFCIFNNHVLGEKTHGEKK